MMMRVRLCVMAMAALLMTLAHAAPAWYPFHWLPTAQPGLSTAQAVVLLPVKLDGKECTMQLDTGAGLSVLYRHALPISYVVNGDALTIDQFSLGSLQMHHAFPLMYHDDAAHRESGCREVEGTRLAGTLGNDVFADGSLSLDLRHARFRFAPGTAPAPGKDTLSLPFDLIASGDRQGQVPVLDAALSHGRHVQLIVDTGSGPVELGVFHEADWLAVVGPDGARNAVEVKSVAWGKAITCRLAPILETVKIGPVVLANPSKAMYCAGESGPLFDSMTEFGLVGLVPFHDKVITFDYVQRRLLVSASAAP